MTTVTKPIEKTAKQPRRQPLVAIIMFNDDDHTFDYVIKLLNAIFGYLLPECYNLAKQIDAEGEAIIWTGQKEIAELKVEQIRNYGPDFYGKRPVNYPLMVEIRNLT